ncbi:beta family protein [Sporomusa sphaeroides]|uniref:beta family protein n=1 Tax=Sporomusa sphaeroides TaxID=47679 RepID=UPI003DA043DB
MYYPLLRWKEGEQGALENLSLPTCRNITPIIDFPINCDFSARRVQNFCDAAVECIQSMPFYLDMGDLPCNEHIGEHPALTLIRNVRESNLAMIPIVRPDNDNAFLTAIQQALSQRLVSKVAVRVFEEEGVMPNHQTVRTILDTVGAAIEDSDLILDLKEIDGRTEDQVREVSWIIGDLGNSYRNTIMLAGSIPGDLWNHISEDSLGSVPRHEWQLWTRARQNRGLRHIQYGDYTTVQVFLMDTPFQGSPRIKYTLDSSWVIARGHRPRSGENQRQTLARRICQIPEFRGSNYSYGDERIHGCANGEWGPGNGGQWVTIDVNQHLTFVANQVSSTLAGI